MLPKISQRSNRVATPIAANKKIPTHFTLKVIAGNSTLVTYLMVKPRKVPVSDSKMKPLKLRELNE